MTLKDLLVGFGTQVRSIWLVGLHAFQNVKRKCIPKSQFTCRPVTVVVSY